MGLIADEFGLQGWFWGGIGALNDNFGALGYIIIGIFALSWLVSTLVYKFKRYDEIEIVE
ncbi:MAG: hypothetical protein POH28_14155 [Acidocella sp.]|nr:hypothetical protein [Acidocella sp.]